MLLVQGWKNAQVHVLMLSQLQQPAQNDTWPPQPATARWQLYRGVYNPPVQTYKDATWEFLDSRDSVGELLYAVVLPEMLLWEDSDQQAKSLQTVLQHIYGEFQKIAQYVQGAVSYQPPVVAPLTVGTHGVVPLTGDPRDVSFSGDDEMISFGATYPNQMAAFAAVNGLHPLDQGGPPF